MTERSKLLAYGAMINRDKSPLIKPNVPAESDLVADEPPLGGTRSEAIQRLQVGLSGVAAMILLVGLANIIQDRARVTEASAVPEAAPTVAPVEPPPQRDPLADAGVVPDLPTETVTVPDEEPELQPELNDIDETLEE